MSALAGALATWALLLACGSTRSQEASPAAAVEPEPAAAPDAAAMTRPGLDQAADFAADLTVATVNDVAISASEVRRLIEERGGDLAPAQALEVLVAETLLKLRARKAGIQVPDDLLNEEMAARIRSLGGWKAYRAHLASDGVSPERDRLDVRDRLRAELYVRHAIGRVPGSPHMIPELARMLDVTPKDVQVWYHEHQDEVVVPARTELAVLQAREGLDAEAAREALQGVPEDVPFPEVQDPRLTVGALEIDRDAAPRLPEEFARFVSGARVGDRSPVFEMEGALARFEVRAIRPARRMTFSEARPGIEAHLLRSREADARRRLVRILLDSATVWPHSLVERSQPTVAPEDTGT